jgi:hypothetical protein
VTAALGGRTLLAPHTELSAALTEALERSYLAAGREVWPTPRVRDFRGWLRERHAELKLALGDLPRCLSDFEERELWRDIIAADDSHAVADAGAAARIAQRARRSVIEYALPWPQLASQGSAETETFLEWNRQFEERCRDLNCLTVDDLLARLETPGAAFPEGEAIAWLDTPSWRPAVRSWLMHHGSALPPAPITRSAIFKMHAASPDAEIAATADWARRRLGSIDDFRAWVCIPDLAARRAEVVDAFDAALAQHRFAFTAES